ncbi:hypothetical protein WMO40_20630 [Bacillaceae bacterium CLA-AA-H227]|uniref:Uncharacterized protein n=1 Tax=Robertmurraya yapensis (ex Hitch et al 2024) TaxID=3133160 RepID=A0ACC6SGC4_9BACI
MLTNTQINNFISESSLIKRSKMLKEIKDENNLSYDGLSLKLFDSVRNLKRLYKLNNLIPEYQKLLEEGKLKKVVAYELSSLSHEQQKGTYKIFKEKYDKWQAKDALLHIEEYQKSMDRNMEIDIYFDNKKLMDTLADELEEKENIERVNECQ